MPGLKKIFKKSPVWGVELGPSNQQSDTLSSSLLLTIFFCFEIHVLNKF